MVQELPRGLNQVQASNFPESAPAAYPVFYRTYSRRVKDQYGDRRESWAEVCDRTLSGLKKLGKLTDAEVDLVDQMQRQLKTLTSGRWLWVGGTSWLEKPENFSGGYNCTSTNVIDWHAFGLMMDLAMQGSGTGAMLEPKYIDQLPVIRNQLQIKVTGAIGHTPSDRRRELTEVEISGNQVHILVGDSRKGWVKSYEALLELCSDVQFDCNSAVEVTVNIDDVRPSGETLKGFGGMANPVKLPELYQRCANILNKALGRKLNSVECCLLIDEAAVCIVAGNIRRCLPADALVHTSKGLVPIKDVQIGNLVHTPLGFRKILNKFDQGFQDVHEIETNSLNPRATLNHRIAVLKDAQGGIEWKYVSALAEGDRLIPIDKVYPGIVTYLPEEWTTILPPHDEPPNEFTIPNLTNEVAWLIGFSHGRNSMVQDLDELNQPSEKVQWIIDSREIKLCRALQVKLDQVLARFGVTACHDLAEGAQLAISVCNSVEFAKYFYKHIRQPQIDLSVPCFILQGSPQIRVSYLVGLWDSSAVNPSGSGLLFSAVHQGFARQVGAVLSSLCLASKIEISCEFGLQAKYNLILKSIVKFRNEIIQYSVKGNLKDNHSRTPYRTNSSDISKQRELAFSLATRRSIGSEDVSSVDIPVTVKGLGSYDHVQTYDIEVEEAQCFYCDGYLTHNSAGMRQGDSNDPLFIGAKENLWQQDAEGNWRIDPERDALRMANHTRVFHRKPTLEECIEAVRKQYYSGEGAIQWAGEAIARSNADLLTTPEFKKEFIRAYSKDRNSAIAWLKHLNPDQMSQAEIEHRLGRYALNPCGEITGQDFHCVAGETMLVTRSGLDNIRNLVGQTIEIWNGKRWSPVVPIQTGRDRQLYRVSFSDGTYLDVTEQHRFFVCDRFHENYEEVTTAELAVKLKESKYRLHTQPFEIEYAEGNAIDPVIAYTLGQLVGDGSICRSNGKLQLQLRLYGTKRDQELTLAGSCSGQKRYYTESKEVPCLLYVGFQKDFDAEQVQSLKNSAIALEELATWDRASILQFVAGLADADGTNVVSGGIRLYLSDYDRAHRVYLLLLKCGIRASINLASLAGTQTNLGIRKKDLWYLQITNCAKIPCQRLDTSKGHQPLYKGKWQNVISIEALAGSHDTYCFNEVEFHKGVFGGTLTGQCNLSEVHLNRLDPHNPKEQEEAFRAGAISVATLLNHQFQEPRYRQSRELDPIVGVSFTGLFDFFVHAFGVEWLNWWENGRPNTIQGIEFKQKEADYLNRWRETVHQAVWEYCDRHQLKRPNRCTTVQPAGCLDRTALRIFDQGLLYADEVVEAGSGESKGLDLSVRNGISTDTAIANQPLNLVRVTLGNGRILRMTPNHRLAIANQIANQWVRADHLQLGMEIDYSLGEYQKQQEALLLNLNSLEYTRAGRKELLGHGRGVLTAEITTPTTLNPELGYFLGCLFGDGAMSECKDRVRFAFNEKELDLIDRLQAIAQSQFGFIGTISHDPRNGGTRGELTLASRQLFDWLKLNQLQKGSSKELDRIPLAIRKSSRETILAFFCGLIDTDGCVREKGSLTIDSSSESFIRNLQQVGEAVGLCFSIFHNDQGENFQGQKNMWGLCLSRMLSQPESLAYLNSHSRKCQLRPLPEPKRQFAFHPYRITNIEFEITPDYSYDFAVSGTDDDDSWYWQGALKSHNTKSLLTGASPGWHPPKAQRFIRRITCRKNDPVALACFDYGYNLIPSQSDKDENGNLLNDPFDPRCTEWLVEIPVAVSWADLPGCDQVDISKFSALTQMDFYMQVQNFYTRHNTSATIELREAEIEPLGTRIFEAIAEDEGYISAALLARFDDLQTFPRLPFEPIDQATFEQLSRQVLARRKVQDFHAALTRYDAGESFESGPAGCDSDKCMLPEQQPG